MPSCSSTPHPCQTTSRRCARSCWRRHAELTGQRELITRLRLQLARLRRMQFGRSSERLASEADQLELALEDLETDAPAAREPGDPPADEGAVECPERRKPARRPLPDHLPREIVEHGAQLCTCPDCGAALPSRRGRHRGARLRAGTFRVIRHVRPACPAAACETHPQAPTPRAADRARRARSRPARPCAVAKYGDHLPLYRQSEIYAREGVDARARPLPTGSAAAALLRPLVDALGRHVRRRRLHGDDTPVPVLAPGTGKTAPAGSGPMSATSARRRRGRRPPCSTSTAPTARASIRKAICSRFRGVLQADGYGGFDGLYAGRAASARPPAGRMSGASSSSCTRPAGRRWPTEALAAHRPASTPSRRIRGLPPDERAAHAPGRAVPMLEELQRLARDQPSPGSPARAPRRSHPLRPQPLGAAHPLLR